MGPRGPVGPRGVSDRSGSRRRWPGRIGLVAVIVIVLVALGGIAYANWMQRIAVDTSVGNGYVDLWHTDPAPDFVFECASSPNTCTPASQHGQMTFQNTGSIPINAYLRWDAAGSVGCEVFDVTMAVGTTTIFDGSLCDLLATPKQISAQLDPTNPGESAVLDITVTPDTADPAWTCPLTLTLTATVSWSQWTDSPGSSGWGGSSGGDFEVRMSEPKSKGSVTTSEQGSIVVDVVTVPGGDPQSFTFDPSWSGTDFSLTDGAKPHQSGLLDAGVYSVTETVPEGWELTSATCDDGSNPSSIGLEAGETVTCTFTNSESTGTSTTSTTSTTTTTSTVPASTSSTSTTTSTTTTTSTVPASTSTTTSTTTTTSTVPASTSSTSTTSTVPDS